MWVEGSPTRNAQAQSFLLTLSQASLYLRLCSRVVKPTRASPNNSSVPCLATSMLLGLLHPPHAPPQARGASHVIKLCGSPC